MHLARVAASTLVKPLPKAKRLRTFAFFGSLCCDRSYLIQALDDGESVAHEIADMRTAMNATAFDDRAYLGERMRNWSSLVRTSQFVVEPYGDTPEREQIYSALHQGTPLVFPDPVMPPLGLGTWNGTAISSSVLFHTGELSSAIEHFDKLMLTRFEDARAFLCGVPNTLACSLRKCVRMACASHDHS